MRLGVVFPQTEIGPDPNSIRTYAEAVTSLGFDHILIFDHVTSVDRAFHPDFINIAHRDGAVSRRPYDLSDQFHEIFVLMGYLSALCPLELVTGVLVLPQRPTALVAKQAAEIDVLTGGKFRLGVGIGWNRLEFRSLGADFDSRAARLEVQVARLREYWTRASVPAGPGGEWGEGMGLNPLPVQRPIPIWIAGGSGKALDRVGRLGDGWLPVAVDPDSLASARVDVRRAATAVGRDPETIGLQGRLPITVTSGAEEVRGVIDRWKRLGATHVAIDTMKCGFTTVDEHIDALRQVSRSLYIESQEER